MRGEPAFNMIDGRGARQLEDWSDLPSMVNDYDRARAALDARIEGLLDRLSAKGAARKPLIRN